MANGIRTGDPRGFKKGRSSKFRVGSRVRQTLEEGRRSYQLKRSGNNNEDKDNSQKILNDTNLYQLMIYTLQMYPKMDTYSEYSLLEIQSSSFVPWLIKI